MNLALFVWTPSDVVTGIVLVLVCIVGLVCWINDKFNGE